MADQNQSPASQASVSLSGITFPLQSSGTPTYRQGGPLSVTLLAKALGSATTASSAGVSGLFTLNEQCAAKRLGAWPGP